MFCFVLKGRIFNSLVVSYADRVAAFAMPLLMLRGATGSEVYLRIEFVIAISVLVATFADAGLRNYVLFHFGRSRDVERTTLFTVRAAIFVFAAQIVLLGAGVAASQALFLASSSYADLWLGVLRGIALSIIGVATQILIIHDRPLVGILLSLSSWLIAAIALVLPQGTSVETKVLVFFAASFLVVLSVPILFWRLGVAKPAAEGLAFLREATTWGWPLLLGAAATMLIPNITRIYGISNLSATAAIALVFWMRIFSIIQLSHRAAIMIVSRSIFTSDERTGISGAILRTYAQMVGPAVVLAFAVGLLTPLIDIAPAIKLPYLDPAPLFMIGIQVTLWCLAALLEMPLTRQGRVLSVLLATALPSLLFLVFLVTTDIKSLSLLTAAMACVSALQLMILVVFNFWWGGGKSA